MIMFKYIMLGILGLAILYTPVFIINRQLAPPLIHAFSEGLAPVQKDGRWGYINTKGIIVIQPQFEEGFPFMEGLAPVKIGEKYGYIDRKGNITIKPQFDLAFGFSDGLAPVNIGGKMRRGVLPPGNPYGGSWGYINPQGQMVIKPQFDMAEPFGNGLAFVAKKGKYGAINREGKTIIELTYDNVLGYCSQDMVLVQRDKNYFLVDHEGKILRHFKFKSVDSLKPFKEGLAAFEKDDQWGFIDTNENVVIPPRFAFAESFSQGRAMVLFRDPRTKAERYGFIDQKGNIVIQPSFDFGYDFSEGLAAVSVKGKWGYIDLNGKMVIPPKYNWAESFSEGVAGVWIDGVIQYIGPQGNLIWKSRK